MRAALGGLALATAMLASCGGNGTFVLVTFSGGPAQTVSITAQLTLDGNPTPASVTYNSPGGTMFSFPKTASIEIGSGSGHLTVVANALDGNNKVLGSGMAAVDVVRDKTATLTIDLSGAPDQGDLGPSGTLAIAPMTYDFGAATVGTMSAIKRFTVTNGGTQTSGALQVLIDGMDATDYLIVQPVDCIGKTLDTNATCTIDVQFAPKSAGLVKNMMLHAVAPSGTPGGTASATIVGRAVPKGNLSFNEATHTFPDTAIGGSSADAVFTLKNSGLMPSTTITVSLGGSDAGQFQIATDGCSGSTLTANGSCDVKVHAAPSARGSIAATLSADSAASGSTPGDTAIVSLSGKGLAAAHLKIGNAYTQASPFNLGIVDVGSTGGSGVGSAYTFTVTNDGDLPTGQLNVDTTPTMGEITGLMPQTTCVPANMGGGGTPTVLNAGDSCTVVLGLQPATFGIKNVAVAFSATPGGSASTYVTGTGRDQVTIIVSNTSGDGSSGVISDTATPPNFNCGGGGTQCTATFTRTTSAVPVTFVATPDAASYSGFVRWTMPVAPSCSMGQSSKTCDFMLDASIPAGSYAFVANYTKQSFNLSYNRRDFQFGGGGSLGTMTISGIVPNIFCTGACSGGPIAIPGGNSITVAAATAGGLNALRRIRGVTCTTGTPQSSTSAAASCAWVMNADVNLDITYSQHNYAFVTSTTYNGNLGGVAGADQKCHDAAVAAGVPGTYLALLSDSSTNARDHLGAVANGWVRIDGLPFAQDKTSLFGLVSGPQPNANWRLYYPLVIDETGTTRNSGGDHARTYSGWDGLRKNNAVPDSNHCANWTTNLDVVGDMGAPVQYSGTPSAGQFAWIDGNTLFGAGCSTQMRLYCFGTDLNSPANPPPPPAGTNKHIFLTANTFTPGPSKSRADMDTQCVSEAGATTWKALVATSTSPASSQTTSGVYAFIRMDNVRVGDHALVTGITPALTAPITQGFSGSYLNPFNGFDLQVWSGAVNPMVAGSAGQDCSDWSNASGTSEFGFSTDTGSTFFDYANTSCATPRRFYCVEQ